jgi:hypothetical protein
MTDVHQRDSLKPPPYPTQSMPVAKAIDKENVKQSTSRPTDGKPTTVKAPPKAPVESRRHVDDSEDEIQVGNHHYSAAY